MQTFQDVERAAAAGDAEAQELAAAVLEHGRRFADAAGWLARAAAQGRTSAVARLGLWRLVGQGMPADPPAGAAQIFAAAEAGDPLGLELAGVISAGGVGTRRDEAAALGWLAAAARAGDGRALCQLGALTGDTDPELSRRLLAAALAAGFAPAGDLLGDAPAPPGDPDIEAALAAADLASLRAPITRELAHPGPRIALIPKLLPLWACRYVIAVAAPALDRGKVVDEQGGESVRQARTNRVMHFGLADSDVLLELINNRLAEAAGAPAQNAEGLGVLNYAPGEEYAPHVDYIPDTPANADHLAQRGQRVRTLLVYLNEDFEGGATEFVRLDLSLKPPTGWGLVFDSLTPDGKPDPMTLHRGAPPTSGHKWLISKWFRTRALRPAPAA